MCTVVVVCSCISIKFLYEQMSMRWVLEHQLLFVKALLFVIMDLTGEVRPSGLIVFLIIYTQINSCSCLQCFVTVGWMSGRSSGL